MPKTYFDVSRWTPDESWRVIRTVRADPPTRHVAQLAGERRIVFHAALEQAQQQFEAARRIGYESRPLNLFYGLAQAGRAVAAASAVLGQPGSHPPVVEWRSTAHGLSFAPQGSSRDIWNQSVKVSPTSTDTFSRVALALGSPYVDLQVVSLGALLAQLPDFVMEWRGFAGDRALEVERGVAQMVPTFAIPRVLGGESESSVLGFAERYPALRGSTVRTMVGTGSLHDRSGQVWLELSPDVLAARAAEGCLPGEWPYLRSPYVFPATGQSQDAIHPLLTWWLLLFAFSMLARYHPRYWTDALDISSSAVASQIEFLLDMALTSVPQLLAEFLWDDPSA